MRGLAVRFQTCLAYMIDMAQTARLSYTGSMCVEPSIRGEAITESVYHSLCLYVCIIAYRMNARLQTRKQYEYANQVLSTIPAEDYNTLCVHSSLTANAQIHLYVQYARYTLLPDTSTRTTLKNTHIYTRTNYYVRYNILLLIIKDTLLITITPGPQYSGLKPHDRSAEDWRLTRETALTKHTSHCVCADHITINQLNLLCAGRTMYVARDARFPNFVSLSIPNIPGYCCMHV